MNRNQKIIIGVGLGLVLLTGLFPSYDGEWRKEGDNLKQYIGYYFLLSPPNADDIANSFDIRISESRDRRANNFNANILFSRFLIQIIVIVILTFGLMILFADPKYEKKFPINRKDI